MSLSVDLQFTGAADRWDSYETGLRLSGALGAGADSATQSSCWPTGASVLIRKHNPSWGGWSIPFRVCSWRAERAPHSSSASPRELLLCSDPRAVNFTSLTFRPVSAGWLSVPFQPCLFSLGSCVPRRVLWVDCVLPKRGVWKS